MIKKNFMAAIILATYSILPTQALAQAKTDPTVKPIVNSTVNPLVSKSSTVKAMPLKADADGYIDIKSDTVRYNRIMKLAQDKIKMTPEKILEFTKINMYEIYTPDGRVLYFTKDEKYLFDGALVELDNPRVNITHERSLKALPYDEKLLQFSDAIKTVHGKGTRRIVSFEDPNCGYCKKFFAEKLKLQDVTLYTFITPVLGPASLEKSKIIWCSANKEKAWEQAMTSGNVEGDKTCDTKALDRNMETAKKLKVFGTPTIFLSDGTRMPGAVPVEELEKKLQAVKK
jgi:thiol:disulfide interchange protein DsbC